MVEYQDGSGQVLVANTILVVNIPMTCIFYFFFM